MMDLYFAIGISIVIVILSQWYVRAQMRYWCSIRGGIYGKSDGQGSPVTALEPATSVVHHDHTAISPTKLSDNGHRPARPRPLPHVMRW